MLDERALRLSAGQRQKIALARLFLRPAAPLLLLDEPTAHLDPASAAEVDAVIGALTGDRTVILVTHREAPALASGRRLVVHGGAVTELARAVPSARRSTSRCPAGAMTSARERSAPAKPAAARTGPALRPLLSLLRLARPLRGRLLIAAGAGAMATGCGVALLAVSGFLLARASQHPDIAALSVAVVAVRGLSIGRAGFRYAERLASHDVAFRVLAQVRVAIWRRLDAARSGRAARLPVGRPAHPAGQRRRRDPGPVHPRDHAPAGGGARRRRRGPGLPGAARARRACC